MTLIPDAGGLVAIERGDRDLSLAIARERQAGRPPRTHGGVIGQVWRGGSGRQAWLARALRGIDVVPLDDELGRRAGVLLGAAGLADVVDAAVVLLAAPFDRIVTSDPDDLARLAEAAGVRVQLIPA